MQEAVAGVKEGRYKAAIVIPADFSKRVSLQARPEIGLFLDNPSYLLTPLSKSHIVGGLIISGLSITTAIAAVILVVSMLMTGIPLSRGLEQCVPLFIVIVLTTLCLLSLMFVILFFPSGAVYPIASFPGWLRTFAKINPEAYAVHALKSLLFRKASMASISGDMLFLALFTVVAMTLSILTFKRTL